jgi:mRNA-degrading endonuclease HigB of HigAB toxin-antitoxin module
MNLKTFYRLIVLLCLIILLSGCAGLYEGEYEVVTNHTEENVSSLDDNSIREVRNYASLKNALKEFIDTGSEGDIKVVDYPGSIEDDFSKASKELTSEYPRGVFAVDRISYRLIPILSYYKIEVYITYKLTKEEMDSVIEVKSSFEFYDYLNEALEDYSENLAVEIVNLSINEASIEAYVKKYYLNNPELIMEEPSVTVSFYPSPDVLVKIITLKFNYNSSVDFIKEKKKALTPAAAKMLEQIGKPETEAETALNCVNTLSSVVEYKRLGDTAYNAIVEGGANSKGYAMAYKLLCKLSGLNCTVVQGKNNYEAYYWNIVEIDGEYYHVDSCACDRYGNEAGFLKKDSEMWSSAYWWDIEDYEECNGSLTYEQLIMTKDINETLE